MVLVGFFFLVAFLTGSYVLKNVLFWFIYLVFISHGIILCHISTVILLHIILLHCHITQYDSNITILLAYYGILHVYFVLTVF